MSWKLKVFSSQLLAAAFLMVLAFAACKKDEFTNPYDNPDLQEPEDTTANDSLDPTSFAGLHQNIFKPTCANSGCHDGTFEPNFLTIESSYNTLVYHPVTKNDSLNTYDYRVLPGNPDLSIIMLRLTEDIDGISGIMPLDAYYDPESVWNQEKEEHIGNIRTWIENGAKDMFGNPANAGNKEPQFLGVAGFANGNTLVPHSPNHLSVPASANSLDLWFALSDDSTSATALTYNKIKFSESKYYNDTMPELDLQIVSPITEEGYFGEQVQFTHKITISLNGYPVGQRIFFRIYVKDPQHDVTEIPQDGSLNHVLSYFSFARE